MTEDQILWEYRQLLAWETGKESSDDDAAVLWDPEYEAWQKSLGIERKQRG